MTSKSGAIRAGRAYVEAFMDSTKLEKGLGKITDKMQVFSKRIGAIGGSLLGFGAARLAPLAAAVKTFAAAGDQLHKMSIRTGESVESLSALQYAAGQSGVEFEDLIGSMEELNIRLGETIREGTGPASEAFKNLGLDAQKLAMMSPEGRLKSIAQALSQIGDETKRGFLADEIFGGDGFKMLPLLQQGAEGIDELMRRAEELGLVMSSDAAASAAEMTDALDDLWKSVKAVGATVAQALLPEALDFTRFLTETIPEIRKWLAENKEWIVSLAKTGALMVTVGGSLLVLSVAINQVTGSIGAARGLLKLFGGDLKTLGKATVAAFAIAAIIAFAREVYNASDAVQSLNKELERSRELDKELLERQSGKNSNFFKQLEGKEFGADRDNFLAAGLKEAETELAGMNASLEGQKKLVDELAPSMLSLWQAGRANWELEKQELDAINERLKQQRKFVDDIRRAQIDVQRNAGRSDEELKGIESILKRLTEELEEFGLTAAEKAIRSLKQLNANEEELAAAREKLNMLAAKEADKKRADQVAKDAESVRDILFDLKDEIDVLKENPNKRDEFKLIRELQRLGATPEQIENAKTLQKTKEALSQSESSFTAQSGTFSSLSSRIFFGAADTPLKKIEESSKETAKNTRKLANRKTTAVYGP